MISPEDFVGLGSQVEEELARIASGFHVKDDQHDGWAGASDDAREKTDEVRGLLSLPGFAERLASTPALSQADALPITASLDQKRAQFERIYQALAPVFAAALMTAWLGDWEINDDGLVATLRVTQRPVAGTEPGRDLRIEYVNPDDVTFNGWVRKCDPRWHHLSFYVSFGAVSRDFDAYLFKWDKRRLAGVSEGHGFCAVKVRGGDTDQL